MYIHFPYKIDSSCTIKTPFLLKVILMKYSVQIHGDKAWASCRGKIRDTLGGPLEGDEILLRGNRCSMRVVRETSIKSCVGKDRIPLAWGKLHIVHKYLRIRPWCRTRMAREDEAGSKVKLVGNSYEDVEGRARWSRSHPLLLPIGVCAEDSS